jgi:hypothetical protein
MQRKIVAINTIMIAHRRSGHPQCQVPTETDGRKRHTHDRSGSHLAWSPLYRAGGLCVWIGVGKCEPQDEGNGRINWRCVVDVEAVNQEARTGDGDRALYARGAIGGWERAVHGAGVS